MGDTMSSQTPDSASPEIRGEDSELGRARLVRAAVWTVGMLGLLGYLAFGQVSAIWYRYNAFLNRVYREEDSRGFVDIWRSWLEFLPGGSGLTAMFIVSIVVALICVGWGTWLLLVSSGEPQMRHQRSVR